MIGTTLVPVWGDKAVGTDRPSFTLSTIMLRQSEAIEERQGNHPFPLPQQLEKFARHASAALEAIA